MSTGEATVSATNFWTGFLTPFLDPKAAGSLSAFQNTLRRKSWIENFFPTCPQLFLYDKSPREELTSTTVTLASTTLNPA